MKKSLWIMSLFLTSVTASADRPSVHGMVLFGDRETYVSHLPMFHAPHDYQGVFKVTMSGVTVPLYQRTKKMNPDMLFTIEPEVMDLTDLLQGKKKSFSAKLFAGHFERGGKELGSVTLNVTSVIYGAKLNADGFKPVKSSYVVFGSNEELYGVHIIHSKPNFDAIVKLSPLYNKTVLQCRAIDCEVREEVPFWGSVINMEHPGTDLPSVVDGNGQGTVLQYFSRTTVPFADVVKVIYLEQEELSH